VISKLPFSCGCLSETHGSGEAVPAGATLSQRGTFWPSLKIPGPPKDVLAREESITNLMTSGSSEEASGAVMATWVLLNE
jgi:hypothetical protein